MSSHFSWHPHRRAALIGIGLGLLLGTVLSGPAAAQERQPNECITAASSIWTRQELWVWKQLCLRRVANLNESGSFGAKTSIDEPKSWSSQRVLRSSFIEAIMTDPRYSEKLTNRSIQISGAWFRSRINLQDSSLPFTVRLLDSRLDGDVDLLEADISGTISFDGSVLRAELSLSGAKVDGNVFLGNGAKFKRVNLKYADIGGSVVADKSVFEEELDLDNSTVDGNVLVHNGSKFKRVNLVHADIGGGVQADRSVFEDELDLSTSTVDGDVNLREGSKFKRVDLVYADIGGGVAADRSVFEDELDLRNSTVDGNVLLRDESKFKHVSLAYANIGGTLDATKSTFEGDLDLYATQVNGSLLLAESEFAGMVMCSGATIGGVLSLSDNGRHAKWRDSAGINLEGTTVRGLADASEAWPHNVKVAGFSLQQTHSQPTTSTDGFTDREISWYLNDWLSDEEYSREAYKHLEGLLRSVGRNRDADRIAMARLDREYALEGGLLGQLREAGGVLHEAIVGYGYQPERALILIIILILLGAWVARRVPQKNFHEKGVCSKLVLSAQRLIPLISFGQSYSEVDVTSEKVPKWVRRYFYVHATLGYILAAFLVTTLTKITTR